jgi:hypothetical protein
MTIGLKGGGNPRQLSKKLNWPVKHRGLGWRHVLEVGICALITQPPSLMAPGFPPPLSPIVIYYLFKYISTCIVNSLVYQIYLQHSYFLNSYQNILKMFIFVRIWKFSKWS